MADKVLDPDKPKVLENKPKKARWLGTRAKARTLWLRVQSAKDVNKTVRRRLQAANDEFEEFANIIVKSAGRYKADNEKLDEVVDGEFSQDAVMGVLEAVTQAINGDERSGRLVFVEQKALYEACEGFGPQFMKVLKKDTNPPDGDEAEAEDKQDEVFAEEKKES